MKYRVVSDEMLWVLVEGAAYRVDEAPGVVVAGDCVEVGDGSVCVRKTAVKGERGWTDYRICRVVRGELVDAGVPDVCAVWSQELRRLTWFFGVDGVQHAWAPTYRTRPRVAPAARTVLQHETERELECARQALASANSLGTPADRLVAERRIQEIEGIILVSNPKWRREKWDMYQIRRVRERIALEESSLRATPREDARARSHTEHTLADLRAELDGYLSRTTERVRRTVGGGRTEAQKVATDKWVEACRQGRARKAAERAAAKRDDM